MSFLYIFFCFISALVRSLVSKLGSSQRVRLLVYANYALDGLSSKPDPGSSKCKATL